MDLKDNGFPDGAPSPTNVIKCWKIIILQRVLEPLDWWAASFVYISVASLLLFELHHLIQREKLPQSGFSFFGVI